MLTACHLQNGKAAPQMQTFQKEAPCGHINAWVKKTKNGFRELVASNLSVWWPVLKSATSLIAMLHVVKVHRPR